MDAARRDVCTTPSLVCIDPSLASRNDGKPRYHYEGETVWHGPAVAVIRGVDAEQLRRAPDPGSRPSMFYPYLFDRPYGWATGGVNLARGEKVELAESARPAPLQSMRPTDTFRGDTARIVPEPWSSYYGFPIEGR